VQPDVAIVEPAEEESPKEPAEKPARNGQGVWEPAWGKRGVCALPGCARWVHGLDQVTGEIHKKFCGGTHASIAGAERAKAEQMRLELRAVKRQLRLEHDAKEKREAEQREATEAARVELADPEEQLLKELADAEPPAVTNKTIGAHPAVFEGGLSGGEAGEAAAAHLADAGFDAGGAAFKFMSEFEDGPKVEVRSLGAAGGFGDARRYEEAEYERPLKYGPPQASARVRRGERGLICRIASSE
jgi:hypothetical protein